MENVFKDRTLLLPYVVRTLLTAIITYTIVFAPWLLVLDSPPDSPLVTEKIISAKNKNTGTYYFFFFAVFYGFLSISWEACYWISFKYLYKSAFLRIGFMFCAPVLTLAFYSLISTDSSSSLEGNILLAGAIGIGFTATHFAMFSRFVHRIKCEHLKSRSGDFWGRYS